MLIAVIGGALVARPLCLLRCYMKYIILITVPLFLFSCSVEKITNIKLDGSNKILFKEGDVIYITNLDTSRVSFCYTNDEKIKTKYSVDKILNDYKVEYGDRNTNTFFAPIIRKHLDSTQTPKLYVCEQYNAFAELLKGTEETFTPFKQKKLIVKQIDWDEISDFLKNEYYYRPDDSLQLEISIPNNIGTFCDNIKSSYPDAKYLIIQSNVYLTLNFFELNESGFWSRGYYIEETDYDDGIMIAPKIVVDIKNTRMISIDVRSYKIKNWNNLIRTIDEIIREDAEFYNLRF